MRIVFGQHNLHFKGWSSEEEMIHYLSSCKAGYVILGQDAKQYREFFSTTLFLGFSGTSSFGIGVLSEGHGLVPHVLLLPKKKELLFGLNSQAASLRVEEGSVGFRIQLDSLFRSFLHLDESETILVFHEIGVIAIDENGNEKWTYAKDILEDGFLSKGCLRLKFVDGLSVRLSLATGEQLDD